MNTTDLRTRRPLGRTGLSTSRVALSGGYKIPARGVERAYHEYGINHFYWEGRKPGMGEALRPLLKARREGIVLAIQSYDHIGFWLRGSVERALRALGTDHAEILYLGYFNRMPPRRLLEVAQALKDEGKIRFLGITGHNRAFHGALSHEDDSAFDVQMIRYNAAHRGAEEEIFAALPAATPGVVTYTATRWGKLLQASKMPAGEAPLTAADCYRFVLSHPAVDCCLAGPRTEAEMDEGLAALELGPLTPDELSRIRRIGDHVHG